MQPIYTILSIILLLIFFGFLSRKRQRKIDDNNANVLAGNKAKKDFFDGRGKSKFKIDYKGKLIEMDEHFLDLTNEKKLIYGKEC